jgi:hypothetical protein
MILIICEPTFTLSSIVSLVVPAISLTIALSKFNNAFKKELFP